MIPAIAAERADGIAGQAFRVQSRRDMALAGHVAAHDRDVLLVVDVVPEGDDPKMAESCGQFGD